MGSVVVKQHFKKGGSQRSGAVCVKVEVAVLGSPSLNSPYGLCGRKATFQEGWESEIRSCVCVCESRGGRAGLHVS